MASKAKVDLRFTLPKSDSALTAPAVLSLLDGRAAVSPSAVDRAHIDDWTRKAALGSPDAQFQLARILTSGEPLSADNRAAVKWLRKAAEKEHAASQHLLGVLIARAQGVRADPAKAVELFRSAAIMGNADAQYDLGRALTWDSEQSPIVGRR